MEQQTDGVRLLFQINRKMVNTIRVRFDLIRFLSDFSGCIVVKIAHEICFKRAVCFFSVRLSYVVFISLYYQMEDPHQTPRYHGAVMSEEFQGGA